MQSITTVLGEIDVNQLGFCQCHEHLLISKGQSFQFNQALFFDEVDKSTYEVKQYMLAGGSTLIDAQPIGCNRMAMGLAQIAKETGVNLIASTGFHKMIFYPKNHWIFSIEEDELTQIYIDELTLGMYVNCDTSLNKEQCLHKAGIIKTALDVEGLSPQYVKLFKAAAIASLKTGVPIMIHIEQGTHVLELFEFLNSLGVQPSKLIFCHMDRACKDLSIHKEICKKGSYLEFDTIGRYKYHDDSHEITLFKALLESGYEDQLLFSLDTTRTRLNAYGGDIGLAYILTTFIPLMKESGITESQVNKISNKNCSHALSRD